MSLKNRLRLGFDFATGRTVTGSYPVLVSVEPTNRCNLSCVMCPTNAPDTYDDRERGDMSMETYDRILDQLDLDAVDSIILVGGGDPLVGKNTISMVKRNREMGLATTLFTNAVALSPLVADMLLNLDIERIHFSIDGATKDTYENIRLGGKYEKVVNNVVRFCERKIELGKKTEVFVQMIVSEKTLSEIDLFHETWSAVAGVNHVRFKPEIDHLFRTEKKPGTFGRKKCFLPWYFCHFRWNGDVYFCYQDWMCTMAPANVVETDFKDIINSKTMRHCRQLMAEDRTEEIDLCSKCTVDQPTFLEIFGTLAIPEPLTRDLTATFEVLKYKSMRRLLDRTDAVTP